MMGPIIYKVLASHPKCFYLFDQIELEDQKEMLALMHKCVAIRQQVSSYRFSLAGS